MGRQLARRGSVPVAALKAGTGVDGLQPGCLDARDEWRDQIPKPVSEPIRKAAGEDGLLGEPDDRFVLRRDGDRLEPHRHLNPAKLV
jgi:hypothetical protein